MTAGEELRVLLPDEHARDAISRRQLAVNSPWASEKLQWRRMVPVSPDTTSAALGLLRDPVWQFVGAVLALIGIWFAAWLALRRTHELAYEYRVDSLTTVAPSVASEVEVYFRGEAVPEVRLVLVRVFNSGRQSVRASDFEDPFRISFGKDSRILSADVEKVRPLNLKVDLTADTGAAGALLVAPLLLNPRDYFTLKVLLAGPGRSPVVAARIANVAELRMLKRDRESVAARVLRALTFGVLSLAIASALVHLHLAFELVGAATVTFAALVLGAVASQWFDRRLDRDRLT